MIFHQIIFVFSTVICPTVAEVLTQSFVIRLKEMEQLIRDQKQVIEDQQKIIDSSKSGKYNDKNDRLGLPQGGDATPKVDVQSYYLVNFPAKTA